MHCLSLPFARYEKAALQHPLSHPSTVTLKEMLDPVQVAVMKSPSQNQTWNLRIGVNTNQCIPSRTHILFIRKAKLKKIQCLLTIQYDEESYKQDVVFS